MNPGALFGFLYATLVVPREIAGSTRYFEHFYAKIGDFFDLSSEFIADPSAIKAFQSLDFFRLIRNSISHANFSLTEGSAIQMWNNRQGIKTFEVSTDVNRLTNFAIEISNYCIRKRNGLL